MTAEPFEAGGTWHDLEARLDELIALSSERRERVLAELSDTRPEDAEKLRRWLRAIERSDGFLEPQRSETAPAPGLLVGAWRLSRLLGRGGMGEVWLAERADGAFEKHVAIKFIRTDRTGLRERLVQERNVLARLEHPHIARLLDGGIGADGHPYLVTEFVEGIALDRWCRERAPDLDARLAVFRQIAAAVAHAHANLIVHRDLKATNVLVDAQGSAKLLDFGIAKLLGEDVARDATEHALTPDCAAPEQLTGAPITTRTDIYALGALLYQLLSGRPPLAMRGLPLAALVRRACEEMPAAPSREVVDGGIAPRRGSGDLDAIALKALAKRAEERYATVEALLADLDNAAALRPVGACRSTLGYRTRRFLQRNKVAAAAAACIAGALVLGLTGTLWQAHVAAVERDRAEGELQAAQAEMDSNDAADEFLMASLGGDDGEATNAAVHALIERGLRFLENAAPADAAFRAAILGKLIGFAKQAGDTRQMLSLAERMRREYDDTMTARQRAYNLCTIAYAHYYLGENEAGRPLIEEGRRIAEDLHGSARGVLAFCAGGEALFAERRGDRDKALALARRAVGIADELPRSARARAQQLRLSTIFGAITLRSGDAHKAIEVLEPLRLRALESPLPDARALVLTNLGDAYESSGRLDDADRLYAEAEDALHGNGRSVSRAYGLVRRARLKNTMEQPEIAIRLLDRADAFFSGFDNATAIGNSALERARAELLLGDYERSAADLDRADANYRTSLPPHSEFRVYPALTRARIALARGELDRAQAGAESVLAQLREWKIEGPSASCHALLAEIALRRGDAPRAETAARAALALRRAKLDADDWRIADDQALLARALALGGHAAEAEILLDRAVPLLERTLGAAHSHARTAKAQQLALRAWPVSSQIAGNVEGAD